MKDYNLYKNVPIIFYYQNIRKTGGGLIQGTEVPKICMQQTIEKGQVQAKVIYTSICTFLREKNRK